MHDIITPPSAQSGLLYQLRLFFTAVQFFTRLPIPRWVGFDAAWMAPAARYFPAVGIVVGFICAAVYWLLALCLPHVVAILLSTAAGIYFTGALHEDGFADVCDGFGGGMTAARTLEIMRDSRLGAYGVIGLILLLLLKISSLAMLPVAQLIPALLLAHPLSRCAANFLMWRLDYAREEGKAKAMAQRMRTGELMVAVVSAAVPLLLCGFMRWLAWSSIMLALLLALCATLFFARLFVRRIGGYTGDCLGAVQQLSEVAIYLGLLAVLPHQVL